MGLANESRKLAMVGDHWNACQEAIRILMERSVEEMEELYIGKMKEEECKQNV